MSDDGDDTDSSTAAVEVKDPRKRKAEEDNDDKKEKKKTKVDPVCGRCDVPFNDKPTTICGYCEVRCCLDCIVVTFMANRDLYDSCAWCSEAKTQSIDKKAHAIRKAVERRTVARTAKPPGRWASLVGDILCHHIAPFLQHEVTIPRETQDPLYTTPIYHVCRQWRLSLQPWSLQMNLAKSIVVRYPPWIDSPGLFVKFLTKSPTPKMEYVRDTDGILSKTECAWMSIIGVVTTTLLRNDIDVSTLRDWDTNIDEIREFVNDNDVITELKEDTELTHAMRTIADEELDMVSIYDVPEYAKENCDMIDKEEAVGGQDCNSCGSTMRCEC